jgi:hypothetical protein
MCTYYVGRQIMFGEINLLCETLTNKSLYRKAINVSYFLFISDVRYFSSNTTHTMYSKISNINNNIAGKHA